MEATAFPTQRLDDLGIVAAVCRTFRQQPDRPKSSSQNSFIFRLGLEIEGRV
jgi:hypothetical protein